MKTVAIHNLGCKVNNYEMDVMQQMLSEKGYNFVSFDEVADLYIVNTCTVTNIADRKSRQMLHRAKKLNPDSVVVAVGCYVQTSQNPVTEDPAVDLAIGNNRKKDIVQIVEQYLENRKQKDNYKEAHIIDIDHTKEFDDMHLKKPAEHTRAYIKIQDGCNQFCSYCIIPYARGRVRSRQEEEILNEVRDLSANGVKEVVFTGIHVGSYGIDRGGSELLQLLKKVHEIDGIERIRFGSLEPRIITDDFVKEMKGLHKICPHFHLSLQSGCDKTLSAMNRKYTAEEYENAVKCLRKYFEHPAITTDVIVGFPGENEKDYLESKEFCERIDFYEMHVFKYSMREGTVAAKRTDQIPDQIKAVRSDEMLTLERRMSGDFRAYYLGKEVEVLYEETVQIGEKTYQIGHTKEYVKVAKAVTEDLSNHIIKEIPKGFLKEDILLV